MPRHAAACRVFTLESEDVRVGIQTHNAGVAGSSPAPAIAQDAQPHGDSGALTLRSPSSATTGATKRRKNAPKEPAFPVLIDGTSFARQRLIYGLIDPKAPHLVRYVGQTTQGALGRYAQHIATGTMRHERGKRAAWLRQLVKANRRPHMLLLEYIPDDVSLNDREFWWIEELQMSGQADLNAPVPARAARTRCGNQIENTAGGWLTCGLPLGHTCEHRAPSGAHWLYNNVESAARAEAVFASRVA